MMFNLPHFPILTTDRLQLRELTLEDAEDVLLFRGDPYVQRFNSEPLQTVDEAGEFIEEMHKAYAASEYLFWGIFHQKLGKIIGGVGLSGDGQYHRRAEVGYDLAHIYWGNGYATEALQAVVAFGFDQLNLNRIFARTIADNHESVRLLERNGFTCEGIRRGYSWEDDQTFHDSAMFALLRDDFLNKTPSKPRPFQRKTLDPLPDLSEYQNPMLYDLENRGFEPAGSFFLKLAQKFGGDVLEIGCGTGRYTIPLAEKGVAITGLDVVKPMLEVARERSTHLPIRWIRADARQFSLNHRFGFIFTSGAIFMHLLTTADQEAFLGCVRRHLAENGRLLIEVMFPNFTLQETQLKEENWFEYDDNQGRTVTVSGITEYDPISQIRTETAYRRWQENGRTVTRVAPLRLRNTFPQELDLLLNKNGFEIEARYGNYDFGPLTQDSRFMLYLCKREKFDDR